MRLQNKHTAFLVNAGALWTDEPALRDGNLVRGRVVADIPDFCRVLVGAIERKDI
jgi:protease I